MPGSITHTVGHAPSFCRALPEFTPRGVKYYAFRTMRRKYFKERHLKYQSASISSSSTLIPVYGLKLHQFKSRRFVLPKHIIPRLFTSGFSPQPLSTSRPVHVKRQEQLNSTCPVVNLPPVLRHGKGTLVAPTPLAHLI